MRQGSNAKIYLPWHTFLGGLDLEVAAAGFGGNISGWRMHPSFSGDNFFRLYLPVKGLFRLHYEENSYAVEPGSVYLLPSQTPFSYEPVTPSDHFWIHFVSRQLRTLPAMKQLIRLPVKNEKKMQNAFRAVVRGVPLVRTIPEDIEIRSRVFSLLAPFLEQALQNITPDAAAKGRFAEVLDYIDGHLGEPIESEALRALTSLSRADFSALFRRTFGVPPKQYVCLRRITQAKRLLWRSRLSVKEIAERCGYENKYFFYRIFKKYTGQTPSGYRNRGMMD
ncbi:MAG: AraC family transcriptional regulator [Victivallales bacterium]